MATPAGRPAASPLLAPALLALVLLAGCAAPPGQRSGSDGDLSTASGSRSAPAATTTSAPTTSAPTDTAAGQPDPFLGAIGNLGVTDQTGDGTRLRLAAEIDGSAGWVVVQADRQGHPGRVLGLVHRADGVHDDVVVVRLHPKVATGRLWVTLHLDRGRPGVYESPGPDTPLQFAGADLRRPVTLTVTPGG